MSSTDWQDKGRVEKAHKDEEEDKEKIVSGLEYCR
jgi:hypothetical protein